MKRIQGALRNRGLLYFYMSTSKVFFNYTDWCDVDEDIDALLVDNGYWGDHNSAGITRRCMDIDSSYYNDAVASSNMKN